MDVLTDEDVRYWERDGEYRSVSLMAEELLLAREVIREVEAKRLWRGPDDWRWTERPGTRGMTVSLAEVRPHLAAYLDALGVASCGATATEGDQTDDE